MININRAHKAINKVDPDGHFGWFITGNEDLQVVAVLVKENFTAESRRDIYSHIRYIPIFTEVYNELTKIKEALSEE